MKTYLKVLAILIMVSSCQENKKELGDSEIVIENKKTSKKKDLDASKDLRPTKIPTETEFEGFFPKEVGAYNLNNIGLSETLGVGTGFYIKGKDYGNFMHYYVNDGYTKGSAAIRNFEESYQSNHKWSDGSERISKERDGFKTVALLREKYNTYKISMLYNNRFVLTVEGHEKPDELWSYLKQANLKILDSY